MPSTGIAPALEPMPQAKFNSQTANAAQERLEPLSVLSGARCFYWVVALASIDSLLTVMGSHLHRFTGLGVAALTGLSHHVGGSGALHVIVNSWASVGFILLGYSASRGKKGALVLGTAAYSLDAAMSAAAGDYLGVAFHALLLVAIFRGFAEFGDIASSVPSPTASAAHAG